MKPPSAIRQARCEPGRLKTPDGQQRQQAQERRHPLRPLAAVKTPGWEQPQAQRLWRRQLHPCTGSGSSTPGRDDARRGSSGSNLFTFKQREGIATGNAAGRGNRCQQQRSR